ncbi:MAG: SixA phosphatase family protein [Sphingobacteriaceae bacterium]
MRTLYIIRHAKAEEHHLSKSDFYRNLIPKGQERAHRIANVLQEYLQVDENTLAISLPANRAAQTADIFCEALQFPTTAMEQNGAIYDAHFMDILDVINQVSDQFDKLLLFGHNPGLSNLVNYLSHSEIILATSNVAILQFDHKITFSMVSGGTAKLGAILK